MRVPIKLANPNDRSRQIPVESALIDTGGDLDDHTARDSGQVGLEVVGQQTVRSAAGPVVIDQSLAWVEFVNEGRSLLEHVWISDDYPGVLMGAITLEALGFAVDPGTGKLTESELLLL